MVFAHHGHGLVLGFECFDAQALTVTRLRRENHKASDEIQ